MATAFNLTIPQPCHEDWNQMTPQEQGRFCAACQKCVFDLRAKSQAEIRDLYVAQGGDLCGRINVSQLAPAPKPQRISLRRVLAHVHQGGWSQVRRFAFALLLAFGLSATGWAQTAPTDTVQPLIDTHVIAGGITMEPARIAYVHPRPKRITLEGEVMDADYNRLADVEVVLVTGEGKEHTTRTEADGSYKFTVRTTEDFAIFAKRGEERTAWDADEQYVYDEKTGGPLRWYALQFDNVAEAPETITPPNDKIGGTDLEADGSPGSGLDVALASEADMPLVADDNQRGCKCLHEYDRIPHLDLIPAVVHERDTPADTASLLRQAEPAGTSDAPPLDLQLYPNPSHHLVHLLANVTAPTLLKVRILSLEGQEVQSQDWQAQPGIDLSLPIHGLSAATYLIEIRDPEGRHTTQRLVVQ